MNRFSLIRRLRLDHAEVQGLIVLMCILLVGFFIQIISGNDTPALRKDYAPKTGPHKASELKISEEPQKIDHKNIHKPRWAPGQAFDINKAIACQLQQITGIGPVLSKRILKYRDLLGGFVRLEQLGEVYGLQPELVKRCIRWMYIERSYKPRQINVNTASWGQLVRHPYITEEQATAIISRRSACKNLEDLRHVLGQKTYIRVVQYLFLDQKKQMERIPKNK